MACWIGCMIGGMRKAFVSKDANANANANRGGAVAVAVAVRECQLRGGPQTRIQARLLLLTHSSSHLLGTDVSIRVFRKRWRKRLRSRSVSVTRQTPGDTPTAHRCASSFMRFRAAIHSRVFSASVPGNARSDRAVSKVCGE